MAIVQVMILLTKVQRMMGRKSEKVEALSFLGMRTRKELVNYLGVGTPAQKFRKAERTSWPTISQ